MIEHHVSSERFSAEFKDFFKRNMTMPYHGRSAIKVLKQWFRLVGSGDPSHSTHSSISTPSMEKSYSSRQPAGYKDPNQLRKASMELSQPAGYQLRKGSIEMPVY